MFKNYLKLAWRSLVKQKSYSFINITGLSIGMACCVILFLFLQNELSFDRFHANADRIYRAVLQYEREGEIRLSATTPAPLGPAVLNEFPEVEQVVRLGENEFLITYGNKRFYEQVFYADPELFDVFSFPLLEGNLENPFSGPKSILVSEKMSRKYFGDQAALGQILSLYEQDYTVTGIFKDVPQNSHFRFEFLVPFESFVQRTREEWGISNYYTYVLLRDKEAVAAYNAKIPALVDKYRGKETREVYKVNYPLQSLTRIHLFSRLRGEIGPNGNIGTVIIFSMITLFILLLACFNYINLSTARCTTRAREIGLRKVIGASRAQLIQQFLGESFLFVFVSFLLTFGLVEALLPVFNSFAEKNLAVNYTGNLPLLFFLASVFLFVGFFSGSFMSFYVSGFQPVQAMKGMFAGGSRIPLFRRAVIVGQFAITTLFLISALVIMGQLNFMKNKELGFDKEHVINIPILDEEVFEGRDRIKSEFLRHSNVLAASATSFFPGSVSWYQNYSYEGMPPEENPMIRWMAVDFDFLETLKIRLVQGRDFSKDFPTDIGQAYILNETAVKELGWSDPLGRSFQIVDEGAVIGVVEDFHFSSLHERIEPMALCIYPEGFEHFAVRIRGESIPETLRSLEMTWKSLSPGQTFSFSFLDTDLDRLYNDEVRLSRIIGSVTFLSLFIACLGLFGLASFSIERRIKEIGIRKVLGASVGRVVTGLSRDFARWVFVANVIAWPVAYYGMYRWLQNFAYRTRIGIWIFILSAGLALATSVFTIGFQAVKAALKNPVEILRYE